jgi:hypothetical protein
MKPSLSTTIYTSFKDLHEKDFILAHPSKTEVYPILMGRTHNGVVKDVNNEHYRMVHV